MRDPATGRPQHGCLSLDGPVAVEGRAVRRREAPGPLVADVGLGRTQVGPVRLSLGALGVDRDQPPVYVAGAVRREQELDDQLGVLVLALAEAVVADPSLRVGE